MARGFHKPGNAQNRLGYYPGQYLWARPASVHYTEEGIYEHLQVEQKRYQMPRGKGLAFRVFLTVADIQRLARSYEKVFDARILSLGDGNAPGYLQLANIWMILNVGAGRPPTNRR